MTTKAEEIWSDLHYDIKKDGQGAIKKVINIDSVKTSIDNILRTHKGERCMLRDFGSGLGDMVFENMDSDLMQITADEIKETINTWDDRVIVNSINFSAYPDRNSVIVNMNFSVVGYNKVFKHSVTM